jgi:NitT/TauT family transport system ATP-binding protein
MLELTNISHRFDEQWVLKDLDLTLRPGQRLAVMGPSGRGKTTLLRIALGLTVPTAGRVTNTFSSVGAVFQEPRLLPWRTALENVNLVLGDGKRTLAQAEQLLALVGQKQAAKLVHPIWGTRTGYLTELISDLESREDYVAYSFTFLEEGTESLWPY